MQNLIIYSPIQGIGGGVDVDLCGAMEAFSKSKEFASIYLVVNRTTIKRFPELNSVAKIIITPKIIDNKYLRNFFKGRLFTALATFIIPLNTILFLRTNFYNQKKYSVIVFYNATGGALLTTLMQTFNFKLNKKCLSLTGLPSFLLKNCASWRKYESNLIKTLWEFFTLSKFNSVFCLSKSTYSLMEKLFNKRKSLNFVYIPNPSFNKKKIKKLNKLRDQYYQNSNFVRNRDKKKLEFLLVGRFCKQKNQILAINTFKKVIKILPHNRLTFIGEGEEKASLENLVKIYNLQNHIKFKAFSNNLLSKLVEFDAIICTSLWEDSSVFLNETLSIGMPLIAPKNLHGIEDYVKIPKIESLFFDSYTDNSLKKSIIYFQENIKDIRETFLELSSKKLFSHTSKNYFNLTKKHLI